MSAGRQRPQPAAEWRALRIQSIHSHSLSSTAPDRANEAELHVEHRMCIIDVTNMCGKVRRVLRVTRIPRLLAALVHFS
jgi:hypothetical protein